MRQFCFFLSTLMIASVGFSAYSSADSQKHQKPSSGPKSCPTPCSPARYNCPPEPETASDECPKEPLATPCVPFFPQGERLLDDKYLAGYSAPASVKLGRGAPAFYLDGSYIYWHASESGLNIAQSLIATSSTTWVPQGSTETLYQPFRYRSGFKAGCGLEADNWTLDAKYTWIRQKTSTSADAPAANPAVGTGVWAVSGWYIQTQASSGVTPSPGILASTVSSTWRLHMDVGDLVLGRAFYQGPHLTVAPYGGLRGALIYQNLRIAALETIMASPLPYPVISHNNSKSWNVGPRMGADVSCLLGAGFRVIGDFAANILYTRYKRVTHREDTTQTTDTVPNPRLQATNFSTLSPVLEMGLGLGWGSYWSRHFHFNLSATYDFSVWWRQNFMRQIVGAYLTGNSYPGELFLHGGTGTLKIDF